jgi:hypothetical protein
MRLLALGFIALSFSASTLAEPQAQVEDLSSEVKVKLDRTQNKILVKVNKDQKEMPQSLQIVLYYGKGSKLPIDLKATDPWVESGALPGSPQAYFSGQLMQAGQAYTGFEIKIPFRSSKAP